MQGLERSKPYAKKRLKWVSSRTMWFFDVERVALQMIGPETVQYVSNINKYFIAYKSVEKIIEVKRVKRAKTAWSGYPDGYLRIRDGYAKPGESKIEVTSKAFLRIQYQRGDGHKQAMKSAV